jgi:hypothetical protein
MKVASSQLSVLSCHKKVASSQLPVVSKGHDKSMIESEDRLTLGIFFASHSRTGTH